MSALPEFVAPPEFSETGGAQLRAWLNMRCGMNYTEQKAHILYQRLARVMAQFEIDTLDDLAKAVERGQDQRVVEAVVHAASTNHTYFFREPGVLDYFRDHILAPRAGLETRIWSAAASTGDEAYTIAIIACDLFGRKAASESVSILGTDISTTVLAVADAGVFSHVNLEHTPPEIVERHFHSDGPDRLRIAENLRKMCLFRRLNLKISPYPFQRGFHVVFCRNVLYYFDIDTQRAVVEKLYEATEPGGYLITSVTVSIRELGTRWRTVQAGVYRKPA